MGQPLDFQATSDTPSAGAFTNSLFSIHWRIPKSYGVTTTMLLPSGPLAIPDINNQGTTTNGQKTWPRPKKLTIDVTFADPSAASDDPGAKCPMPIAGGNLEDGTLLVTCDFYDPDAQFFFRDFRINCMTKTPGRYTFTATDGDTGAVLFTDTATVVAQTLSARRQHMLDTIDKWMDCDLLGTPWDGTGKRPRGLIKKMARSVQKNHSGELTDIFSLCRWSKEMGEKSADVSDMNHIKTSIWQNATGALQAAKVDPNAIAKLLPQPTPGAGLTPLTTSCGDVMSAILSEWGVDFNGDGKGTTAAFGVAMQAMKKGYYVSAFDAFQTSPPTLPQPGDLLVLRMEGPNSKPPYARIGMYAHVCICYSISDSAWLTADGGGGVLPNQAAHKGPPKVLKRTPGKPFDGKYYGMDWTAVRKSLRDQQLDSLFVLDSNGDPVVYPNALPCIESTTDLLPKLIDGWVDLDRLPNLDPDWGAPTVLPDNDSITKFTALWDRILSASKKS